MIVRSSAYPSVRFSSPFLDVHGELNFDFSSLLSRISTLRIIRYTTIGLPCLQPLSKSMAADRHPFTKVYNLKPCRHVMFLSMKLSVKLKAFIVFLMYSCDILSKALEKSMSRRMLGVLLCFAWLKTSYTPLVISPMNLPVRYTFFQPAMILCKMGFIQIVRTPDMSF